jgi:hypothetical protein
MSYIYRLATDGSYQLTPTLNKFLPTPLMTGQSAAATSDPLLYQPMRPFKNIWGAADVWGAMQVAIEVSPDGQSLWTPLIDALGNPLIFNSGTGNRIVDIVYLNNCFIRAELTGSGGTNVCVFLS